MSFFRRNDSIEPQVIREIKLTAIRENISIRLKTREREPEEKKVSRKDGNVQL